MLKSRCSGSDENPHVNGIGAIRFTNQTLRSFHMIPKFQYYSRGWQRNQANVTPQHLIILSMHITKFKSKQLLIDYGSKNIVRCNWFITIPGLFLISLSENVERHLIHTFSLTLVSDQSNEKVECMDHNHSR